MSYSDSTQPDDWGTVMHACDSTQPSRRQRGRWPVTRPELRFCIEKLAEIAVALGEDHLVDVCERALDGHTSEVIRTGSAIASVLRLLRPRFPGGSG